MVHAHTHDEADQALDDLAAEFPGWRLWRSKDHRGKPVDYVATLRDEQAGRVPTLIATTAWRLREELTEQRDLVQKLEASASAGAAGRRRPGSVPSRPRPLPPWPPTPSPATRRS